MKHYFILSLNSEYQTTTPCNSEDGLSYTIWERLVIGQKAKVSKRYFDRMMSIMLAKWREEDSHIWYNPETIFGDKAVLYTFGRKRRNKLLLLEIEGREIRKMTQPHLVGAYDNWAPDM